MDEKIMENLYFTKFSIEVFSEKKNCEECGVMYDPPYNFCVVRCCGEEIRVCTACNWESVPCQFCRDNNTGGIIISKLKKNCDVCSEEKKIYKNQETLKKEAERKKQ